jgi:DNA-binding MarR family transcriptional regulator
MGDSRDRLSLALARRGATADARLRAVLAAGKLTPRHVTVLLHLEADSACQQELVGILEVDPSVLVSILNDLERAAMIERRRDPADRRRHIVEITEAGVTALKEVDTALEAVEEELFGGLSPSERETLGELLERVGVHRSGDCPRSGLKAALGISS